jgi:hypothetical protein
MDSLSAIQKLQTVLDTLAKNPVAERNLQDIDRLVLAPINMMELSFILDRLEKDSFVKSREYQKQFAVEKLYSITFDGQVFFDQGGYIQAERASKTNLTLAEARVVTGERAQNRLNSLTLWLVVGTIAVAVVEIIKLIYGK